MQEQGKIGRRGLQANYVEQLRNISGKNTYIYTKPGFQSTILDFEEIQGYKEKKGQQRHANQKANPQTRYNLITKMPTNLTKQEKKREQKLKQQFDHCPRTQISKDIVPSEIFFQTISECFNCVDKNVEICELKTDKQNLKRHYTNELHAKQQYIKQLQMRLDQSRNENNRMKASLKKSQKDRGDFQSKYLRSLNSAQRVIQKQKETKEEKDAIQKKYLDILKAHQTSCLKLKQFQDEKNDFQGRLLNLTSELFTSKRSRSQPEPTIKRQFKDSSIVDKMIRSHESCLSKIQDLERQNQQLKKDNEAKTSQIKLLNQSRISQVNSQRSSSRVASQQSKSNLMRVPSEAISNRPVVGESVIDLDDSNQIEIE